MRAHALFYKGLKEVGGDNSQIQVVYGKILNKLLCVKCYGCKTHTLRGRYCRRRLTIKQDGIGGICTEFSEALFEAVVNSS